MEQYPVPQFIEEESRIISFVTFRQFFYLVGAGAVIFVCYYVLPLIIFVVVATVVGLSALALAFFKVDGVPVLDIMLNSIGFLGKAKNYTWHKKESMFPFKTVQKQEIKPMVEHKPLGIGQKSTLKSLRSKVEMNINK